MSPLRSTVRAGRSRSGVTLMELILVSTLTVFLLLVATMISVTQTNLAKKAQQTTLSQASVAVRTIVQLVRGADRLVLYSTGESGVAPFNGLAQMQVVRFQPLVSNASCTCSQPVWPACCVQIPGNWIWSEIAAVSTSGGATPDVVRIFDNTNPSTGGDCSRVTTFTGLQGVTFEFLHDIANTPSGGATNLIQIRVDNITETAMLAGPIPPLNPSVSTTAWDTGPVLSPAGAPPARCSGLVTIPVNTVPVVPAP